MSAMSELAGKSRSGREPVETTLLRGLFTDLASGKIAALGSIYDACGDMLYGLALWRTGSASEAADVVQEVFVRLADAHRRLAHVGNPLAYLRRMTHRAAVDVHRRRRRRREDPIEACALLETGEMSPERQAEATRLSKLLEQLHPAQREAIYLRHFCGCSHAEVARATGVPTFTAASRCRLGLKRLRALLGVTE